MTASLSLAVSAWLCLFRFARAATIRKNGRENAMRNASSVMASTASR